MSTPHKYTAERRSKRMEKKVIEKGIILPQEPYNSNMQELFSLLNSILSKYPHLGKDVYEMMQVADTTIKERKQAGKATTNDVMMKELEVMFVTKNTIQETPTATEAETFKAITGVAGLGRTELIPRYSECNCGSPYCKFK